MIDTKTRAGGRHTRLTQVLSLVTLVLVSVAILKPVQATVPAPPPSSIPRERIADECGGFAAGTTLGQCGFELPALPAASFDYGAGSGWTFVGASGISTDRSGFTGPQSAPEGAQVAFIQDIGSFSQSIDGFVSGSYTLTFEAAQRSNFGGRQDFAVRLDDVVVGVFEPVGYRYREMRVTFVASAGTHTLEFIGIDTVGGDNTAFVDKIRLFRVGRPVCACADAAP
jgi:hypothetical protein